MDLNPNEVTQAMFSIPSKIIQFLEFLMKLLEFLMKPLVGVAKFVAMVSNYFSRRNRLDRAQSKDEHKRYEAKKELEGKTGFVAVEEFKKADISLEALPNRLSNAVFDELKEFCKDNGILFSGELDVRSKTLGGDIKWIVKCRDEDKGAVVNAIGTLLAKEALTGIEAEIGNLRAIGIGKLSIPDRGDYNALVAKKNAGKTLTEQEQIDLAKLEAKAIKSLKVPQREIYAEQMEKRNDIIGRHCTAFNNEQFYAELAGIPIDKRLTFSEALTTCGSGSFIIADMNDPSMYIKCDVERDNDGNYVKTTYESFPMDEKLVDRYPRPKSDEDKVKWHNDLQDFKARTGFSDMQLKFSSKDDYDKYMQKYRTITEKKSAKLDSNARNRDYQADINCLKNALRRHGVDDTTGTYRHSIGDLGAMENYLNTGNGRIKLDLKRHLFVDAYFEFEKAVAALGINPTDPYLKAERDNKETEYNESLEEYQDEINNYRQLKESCIMIKQIENYEALNEARANFNVAYEVLASTEPTSPEWAVVKSNYEACEIKYGNCLEEELNLFKDKKMLDAVLISSERVGINNEITNKGLQSILKEVSDLKTEQLLNKDVGNGPRPNGHHWKAGPSF